MSYFKRLGADIEGDTSASEQNTPSVNDVRCCCCEASKKVAVVVDEINSGKLMSVENTVLEDDGKPVVPVECENHHESTDDEFCQNQTVEEEGASEKTPAVEKDVCCVCGVDEDVKRCGKCKLTRYCSKSCQKQHHDHHEKWCSVIADLAKVEMDKLYRNLTVRQEQVDNKTRTKMLKLVGEKPMLKCFLDGEGFEALWDTGSMISLVSRKWLKENFPDKNVIDVSEFVGKKLSVRAANATEIKFDGVVLLKFTLAEDGDGFIVPVLVSSGDVADPILGYNVIEELVVNGSKSQHGLLKSSLNGGGRNVEIDLLVSAMQEKYSDPDYLADIKSSDVVHVPAGRKVRIRCRVKVQGSGSEQIVYFMPRVKEKDEELTFTETVCKLRRGRTNYVYVDVLNETKRDRVLPKGEIIGSMHSVGAVIPMVRMVNVDTDKTTPDETVEVGCMLEEEEEGTKQKWDLSHLEEDQREMLEAVLEKNKDVFSENDSDIGDIPDFQMPIHLKDQEPVTAAYRKIPPNLYSEIKNYIDDLVSNGWVRESCSSYSSPIVCVRKKDGSMRMCVDYRALNAKTVPDSQPIPRIQDILDSLGGSKWFSTLDMSKAYHQGYIDEKFRHLTAFVTPWALYEWLRIPFGLRNAPPAFQRYINQMLGDLKGAICEPYLDDVLCFSKTFVDHVNDLDKILVRMRARGIKLRAEKCVFAKNEVRYLGRLVSGEGYRPDPKDVAVLEKFRTPPANIGELRSLLGFLGYYRCYVKDFSRKVKPLYDMLKVKDQEDGKTKRKKKVDSNKKQKQQDSKVKITWKEEHQEILEMMITYLQSAEVIAYPDFNLPFFIHCDASNQGLGAVLYQTQEGVDRVISYGSRTLSEAEKNYNLHSGKLEFLALKWAITERFSDYLIYGPHFTVYTDNNPLTYVLTTAKLNAVGLRWVNELSNYNFTIKYRRGKENVDADYLSRRPMDIAEFRKRCNHTIDKKAFVSSWKKDEDMVVSHGVSVDKLSLEPDTEVLRVSKEELKEKQLEDIVIGPVYRAVLAGCRPKKADYAQLSWKSKVLMKNFQKLQVVNGILRRETAKFSQIVLPTDFHQMVYTQLHENMGHLGHEKVVDLCQQRFYWPHLSSDVKNYIQKKCRCVANKAPNVHERAPLVPIEATRPFQMVSIDFLHLDACKGKYEYVLMVTDHYTRFCQMYATRSKSSKAAADKLFNEFILQFGYPEKIHHDKGPEFNSKLFAELHRLTGIRASNTTPYHPAGDGQVERLNRTLINMLKSLSGKAKKDWKSYLPKLAFAYNSTVHKSTGFSPFYLLFGRRSVLPIDLAFEEVEVGQGVDRLTHKQFVEEWHRAMKEARELAGAKIEKSAEYNKKAYDKKAKAVDLVVGDHVLMKNVRERGGTGKLRSFWEETVFTIVGKRENLPVYKIRSMKNGRDIRVIHRNLLMKCNELPVDVFEDKGTTAKTSKEGPAVKAGKTQKSRQKVSFHEVQEEDSEEDDFEEMLIVRRDEYQPAETPVEDVYREDTYDESFSEDLDAPEAVVLPDDIDMASEPDRDDSLDGADDLEGEGFLDDTVPYEMEDENPDNVSEQSDSDDDSPVPARKTSARHRKRVERLIESCKTDVKQF